MMLDLDSVRLFVLATELGSLTRAAEAAGTVQPVVSQRLRALERQLGRRLLDRSPRLLRLTDDGARFLVRARALLAAHDEAMRATDEARPAFAFGASDHALGDRLEGVMRAMAATLPGGTAFTVAIGLSQAIRERFLAGELEAAVLRREAGAEEGEVLGHDPLGWRAAAGFRHAAGEPLPLLLLPPPCGVRGLATRRLDQAGIAWREAVVAPSCAALAAAARAGLGIAPMGLSASGDLLDQGEALGLPPLPPSEIVLAARASGAPARQAVAALARAVRQALA